MAMINDVWEEEKMVGGGDHKDKKDNDWLLT